MLRLTHARDGGTERKKTLLRARLSRGVYRGIGNIVVHAIRASLGGYCVIADLLVETSRFGFSCRRRVVLVAIRRVTAGSAMRARRASIITRGKFDVLKKEGKKGKQNGGVTRVIENCSTFTALHVQRERKKERKKRQEM